MSETKAQYLCPIGKDRIVSFVNQNGVAIPDNLESVLYDDTVGGTSRQGNRKISLLVSIDPGQGEPIPEDKQLQLTVKVPDGILSPGAGQDFSAWTGPAGPGTHRLDYYPQVKVSPYSLGAVEQYVCANVEVGLEDVDAQTVTVYISNRNEGAGMYGTPLFLVEIDWSHSAIN